MSMRVVLLAVLILPVLIFAEVKLLHRPPDAAPVSSRSVFVTPQTIPAPRFTTPAPVDPPKSAPASRAAKYRATAAEQAAGMAAVTQRPPRPTVHPTVTPTHSATPVPLIIVPITPTATASHVRVGAICNDGHVTHKIKDCPCKHHHGVREWLYA